ncbi:hypothetical protein BD414DRAFT_251111 [Trametes punicea]|nr:hypothetical protein BD414DRAFT_251111 [Trametes punicea]
MTIQYDRFSGDGMTCSLVFAVASCTMTAISARLGQWYPSVMRTASMPSLYSNILLPPANYLPVAIAYQ